MNEDRDFDHDAEAAVFMASGYDGGSSFPLVAGIITDLREAKTIHDLRGVSVRLENLINRLEKERDA
tara:strand:- start:5378 stop:5578 length:201 start_codon:yes stop_codon:yes gene_type:complete